MLKINREKSEELRDKLQAAEDEAEAAADAALGLLPDVAPQVIQGPQGVRGPRGDSGSMKITWAGQTRIITGERGPQGREGRRGPRGHRGTITPAEEQKIMADARRAAAKEAKFQTNSIKKQIAKLRAKIAALVKSDTVPARFVDSSAPLVNFPIPSDPLSDADGLQSTTFSRVYSNKKKSRSTTGLKFHPIGAFFPATEHIHTDVTKKSNHITKTKPVEGRKRAIAQLSAFFPSTGYVSRRRTTPTIVKKLGRKQRRSRRKSKKSKKSKKNRKQKRNHSKRLKNLRKLQQVSTQ